MDLWEMMGQWLEMDQVPAKLQWEWQLPHQAGHILRAATCHQRHTCERRHEVLWKSVEPQFLWTFWTGTKSLGEFGSTSPGQWAKKMPVYGVANGAPMAISARPSSSPCRHHADTSMPHRGHGNRCSGPASRSSTWDLPPALAMRAVQSAYHPTWVGRHWSSLVVWNWVFSCVFPRFSAALLTSIIILSSSIPIWVCLKIVYPYIQWLMIIIPTKWL